jgi:polar amino acid transport system substrate-binding protein
MMITVFFLLFSNPQAAMAESPEVLSISENDWPPYFFAGKPDSPEGIGKEILKMCISEAGYGYKFEFYPVRRMYSYLEDGKMDIAVFSYKKERESFVIYGKEPIFSSGYRPVVLASGNIKISSLKDFDKLKVGHLAGLQYSKPFLEYIEKRRDIIVTTAGDSCLKMLLSNIIDVFADTKDTVLWRAKQMNALDKIRVLDFDIQTSEYFITISKKSAVIKEKEMFLNSLDYCLKAAKTDGRYARIFEKYGIR